MYKYDIYGLTVSSDFSLTLPTEAPGDSSDVRVILELVRADNFPAAKQGLASADDEWFRYATLDDGSLYMRWENMFDFVITADGRRVRCRRLFGAEVESFEVYLTTFAISAALILQGEEPLHATVVATEDGAVGLIGASGAGKSTLAAFLVERGGDLVTDDMLRLEFKGDIAMAFPGPRRLKLFKEAADKILKEAAVERGRFNLLSNKLIFQLAPLKGRCKCPQPLSALYLLETPPEHGPNSISIQRLFGVDLFTTIAGSTFNSRINAVDRLERQFHFARRIAGHVPVYRLRYPRDYDTLNQVADLITQTAAQ
jgi:hypothetical protein